MFSINYENKPRFYPVAIAKVTYLVEISIMNIHEHYIIISVSSCGPVIIINKKQL